MGPFLHFSKLREALSRWGGLKRNVARAARLLHPNPYPAAKKRNAARFEGVIGGFLRPAFPAQHVVQPARHR